MSLADQEYLLKVENREAVVRTLHSKLLERDYGEEDSEEEKVLQYNHATQDSSDEQQSLDSAFEEELNAFRSSIDCKSPRPEKQQRERKLVPNVTKEWLCSLKAKLAEQSYCTSSSKQQARLPHGMVSGVYCMTTSTGGTVMSFNSPRATERPHGYELYTDECCEKRGKNFSFMNI